jgi:enterochelin esterase-like enzyme
MLTTLLMMAFHFGTVVAAEVPKGTITKHSFTNSLVFPGTTRDYWLYVPAQYDAAKPACVHVNQDGIQFNAPSVFDQLIASKEMPVTIGIFVTPGKVKALSTNALDRFNRSYEYDSVNDTYARFLLDELLPHIVREHKLNLSTNGNDRSIGGSSSGAVCAFTAAWERPDAFSRVFSAIGTYVGLRGGDRYPTLIRKTEPKPLRVFLQDGSADLNIYGGDWWMANQAMERALTFSGYEVNHVWGDGGHSGKHATELFADAMRWLWKDWPALIKTGLGSKQLQDILIPSEGWERVTVDFNFPEDPAVKFRVNLVEAGLKTASGITRSPDHALLYAADSASHWVYSYQIQPDNTLAFGQKYYYLHSLDTEDNAIAGRMCVDRDGRLYVATAMGVQVCDQAGRVNCILPTPSVCRNLCFTGDNFDTLFVLCDGKIFKRTLKVKGANPFLPPIKPLAPKL